MDVKVLGCSGGVGPDLRTTSFLVNGGVLIDAGTGVCDLTTEQMRKIRSICLTHAHLDHVCGAAFMCDNVYDAGGAGVTLYSTHETLAVLRNHLFNWQLWPDFSALPSPENPTIAYREAIVGQPFEVEGLTVTPVQVDHTVPCVGYIVESGGSAFAFSGDTATNDSFWEAIDARADVSAVIVELSFPAHMRELAQASKHYTAESLAADLAKLTRKPEILISHNKPGCEFEIRKEVDQYLGDWNYRFLTRGESFSV